MAEIPVRPKKRSKSLARKPSGPPAAFREYIAGLVDYCLGLTFQSEYIVRTYWKLKPADDEDESSDTCASVTFNHVYLQIALSIYPALVARWKDKKYETCGNVILHEMCHGFLKPLQHIWQWNDCEAEKKGNQEIVERQTTRIANSIADLLPRDWFMPEVVITKMKKNADSRIRS